MSRSRKVLCQLYNTRGYLSLGRIMRTKEYIPMYLFCLLCFQRIVLLLHFFNLISFVFSEPLFLWCCWKCFCYNLFWCLFFSLGLWQLYRAIDWKKGWRRSVSYSFSCSRGMTYSVTFLPCKYSNFVSLLFPMCRLYCIFFTLHWILFDMTPFWFLQTAEEENLDADSKFRALVAIGSLVYFIF